MELEKSIIIDELVSLMRQDVLDSCYFGIESEALFDKDPQQSETMRRKGNTLFAKKNHNKKVHERIWMLYNKSVALALNGSEELAAAYANRSALLLHLNKVHECLLDIERALKITKASTLKVKLFCRQSECYALLHEEKARNSLTKAKHWLKKVESDSDIEKLNETITKTDRAIKNNTSDFKDDDSASKIPYSNDFIDIRYNQTSGKHVVATKDIQPGEFFYAEEFYVTSVNGSRNYACCSHCLGISWTLIPCDGCSIYLFCSEKCKSEAWEKYHDVECSLKFLYDSSDLLHYYLQLSIKSLIIGIKETGSIKKLQDLILKIEQSTDNKSKGFLVKNKSAKKRFKYLISLTPSKREEKLQGCVADVVKALFKLIKNTHILPTSSDVNSRNLKNIIQNEDIIFIGSVLLRLMSICCLNASHTLHFTEACQGKDNYSDCLLGFCCSRGMYLSPITKTFRHNCNNNVDKICTNDGRVMYYALHPINKNDEIKFSYCASFTVVKKADRQQELSNVFELHCDCLTCQEDWPIAAIALDMLMTGPPLKHALRFHGSIFVEKYNKIIKAIGNTNYKPSKKTLNSFAEDIKISFGKNKQPNVVVDSFTYILLILIENRYCIKLHVPEECKSMSK